MAFSVSVSGGEYQANDDAATLTITPTTSGGMAPTPITETLDFSSRYGLAATTTLTFNNGLVWNTSVAGQNAKHLWNIYTGNTNIIYKGTYAIGASYVTNNFKNDLRKQILDTSRVKDAKSYIVYASYTLPLFDLNNADINFAASYSDTKNVFGREITGKDGIAKFRDEKTLAFRLRFNYAL